MTIKKFSPVTIMTSYDASVIYIFPTCYFLKNGYDKNVFWVCFLSLRFGISI